MSTYITSTLAPRPMQCHERPQVCGVHGKEKNGESFLFPQRRAFRRGPAGVLHSLTLLIADHVCIDAQNNP